MLSLKNIVAFILVAASVAGGSVVGPLLAPAPAPAISYTRAIPYNVPPFAASVNIFNRYLAAPVLHAAPGLLPPVGVLPAVSRSIHPPSLVHAIHPALGVAPHALAGPLPLGHALGAPLPHALAAPFPYAAAPAAFPHAFPAPALGAPSPHALAGPAPHPFAGPGPAAFAAPAGPLWRR